MNSYARFLAPVRLAAAALLATGALTAQAVTPGNTVNFEFFDGATSVATGSFSYGAGAPAVVHYTDLSAFSFSAMGQTYTLADVNNIAATPNNYLWFAYDTATNTLQTGSTQGFPSVMAAATPLNPGTGFFVDSLINPNPGPDAYIGVYQPYNFTKWTSATVTAVPEPETYAMLLAGLGAVGFAARRRQPR